MNGGGGGLQDRLTGLWSACQTGHVEVATLLLEHKADVDVAGKVMRQWSVCRPPNNKGFEKYVIVVSWCTLVPSCK